MIHLTQDEHQRLLSQGKQLFQTITTSRTSSLEIPSYLIKTTTYTHNQLPIVTKSQIEIHRLTQENKALQAHIATFATTTTSPSNSPQRRPHKQLRNLDKEGALHQENNTLRTQLRKSTAYETHTTVKIQELETKNKHLEAKLQLFRIELQRKDTIKNATTINSTSSTTPVSSTLSKQAELNQTENVRLRRLLAERNELTIHLKNDLERVAKERLVMRRTIKNLKSQIYIRVTCPDVGCSEPVLKSPQLTPIFWGSHCQLFYLTPYVVVVTHNHHSIHSKRENDNQCYQQ